MGRLHTDRRRAGDRYVVAEVLAVRRRLPVSGAWAFGRRGDVVFLVFDECYTDDEIAERVELVKLSLDDSGNRSPR